MAAGALVVAVALLSHYIVSLTTAAKTEFPFQPLSEVAPYRAEDPLPSSGRSLILFTSFEPDQPSYFAEDSFAQGTAFAEHGYYQISVNKRETRIKSAINALRPDYRIEVQAGLGSASAGSYYGLMVRAGDNSGSHGVSLEINTDGMWRVTAEDPYGETVIVRPWTPSHAIVQRPGSNVIAARVIGPLVDFYINGETALRLEEAPATGTFIALIAGTTPDADRVQARFGYVLVELEDTASALYARQQYAAEVGMSNSPVASTGGRP
jgi:hypothetical protein